MGQPAPAELPPQDPASPTHPHRGQEGPRIVSTVKQYKGSREATPLGEALAETLNKFLSEVKVAKGQLSWRDRDNIARAASDIMQVMDDLKPSGKGRGGREIRRMLLPGPGIWARWLDHFTVNGDEFISEPYDLSLEDLEGLVATCRKLGLTFVVTGESYHFPGRTFRITLTKPKGSR